METYTTHDITVNVQSQYEHEHSNIKEKRYVFSYLIEIINEGSATVQLLRRHWIILDSNGIKREVQGDGVVGEQPTLRPGESYRYTSWCPFNSEIGMMKGYFSMKRLVDQHTLRVTVPAFTMCARPKLN